MITFPSTFTYDDAWGMHVHVNHGSPYETRTRPGEDCAACESRLLGAMIKWHRVLTKRHSLPANFWKGAQPWTTL